MFPHLVEESLVEFIEQSSRFHRPLFAGDTVYPALEVSELTPQRTTDVVGLSSMVHNQRGGRLLDGSQRFVIRKRPAGRGPMTPGPAG